MSGVEGTPVARDAEMERQAVEYGEAVDEWRDQVRLLTEQDRISTAKLNAVRAESARLTGVLGEVKALADEWFATGVDGSECDPTRCEVCVTAENAQAIRTVLASVSGAVEGAKRTHCANCGGEVSVDDPHTLGECEPGDHPTPVAGHEQEVRADEVSQWADWIEHGTQAAGLPEPFSLNTVLVWMRSGRKPFGVFAARSTADDGEVEG